MLIIFSDNKLFFIFFSFVKSINSYSGNLAFLYLFIIRWEKYFPFIILLYVSIEGTAEIKFIGISSKDALEIANIAFSNSKGDETLRYDFQRGNFQIQKIKERIKIRVPEDKQRNFFGNKEARRLYENLLEKLREDDIEIITIDFSMFLEAGRMLFDGPWVAERYSSLYKFLMKNKNAVLDTTLKILENGQKWSGKDVFEAQERVKEIQHFLESELGFNEFLMTPTVGLLCKISDLKKDPIGLNSNLGYYSYFANILDLSGISIPAAFYENGMPFGVTIFGKAFEDSKVGFVAETLLKNFPIHQE